METTNPLSRISIRLGTSKLVQISAEEMNMLQKIRAVVPDVLVMIDNGVFDFKRGVSHIHRDDAGQLRKIVVELTKWSK